MKKECKDCGAELTIPHDSKVGEIITGPNCGSDFEHYIYQMFVLYSLIEIEYYRCPLLVYELYDNIDGKYPFDTYFFYVESLISIHSRI